MTNKERFLALVSEKDTKTIEGVKGRIRNRAMLRESQQIALKVLTKLDDLGWSQKDFAKAMKVTPQQITKIVSGKANLTLESIVKIQSVLGISILASSMDERMNKFIETIEHVSKNYTPFKTKISEDLITSEKKEVKMSYDETSDNYSFESEYNRSA